MRKLICIISMALNLVLLAFIFFPQSPIIVREAAPESSPVWRRPRVEKLQVARATNVVDGILHWSQVESSDYAIYISNLRAIGCPKQTTRDIVMADVEDLFAQRRLELVKDPVQRFWDLVVDEKAMEKVVDEKQGRLRDLHREKKELLEKLLGSGYQRKSVYEDYYALGGRLGFLSPEKREQVLALCQSFAPQWEQVQQMNRTDTLFGVKSKETSDSFGVALSRILTPGELEEFELQMSSGAHSLRKTLEGFEATESEFRQMYAKQRPSIEKHDSYAFSMEGISDATASLVKKEVGDGFLSLMGPGRQADFALSQDERFRRFYTFTERVGLPRATAIRLHEISVEIGKMSAAVKKDQTLASEERERQLGAIKAVSTEMVIGAIGTKNYTLFKAHFR